MRYFQFLLLLAIFASLSCQTQSKNSENPPAVLPPGDPWFASARLGDWPKLEQLKKDLNRDWDFRSPKGITVLMIAARNGQLDTIKNLLNKNVSINETDELKYNALSYSLHGPISMAQKQKTCTLLVQNGADAFAEDHLQLTPLQLMIELGFIECIKAVKLSANKPCDQAQHLTQIKSLVTYAKDEDEPVIALHFATQGCQ